MADFIIYRRRGTLAQNIAMFGQMKSPKGGSDELGGLRLEANPSQPGQPERGPTGVDQLSRWVRDSFFHSQ